MDNSQTHALFNLPWALHLEMIWTCLVPLRCKRVSTHKFLADCRALEVSQWTSLNTNMEHDGYVCDVRDYQETPTLTKLHWDHHKH